MRAKNCVICGDADIKVITGHVNLKYSDGTMITIFASFCTKCHSEESLGAANPYFKKYKTGYYGMWKPYMGIKDYHKNNKRYKELQRLSGDYEENLEPVLLIKI